MRGAQADGQAHAARLPHQGAVQREVGPARHGLERRPLPRPPPQHPVADPGQAAAQLGGVADVAAVVEAAAGGLARGHAAAAAVVDAPGVQALGHGGRLVLHGRHPQLQHKGALLPGPLLLEARVRAAAADAQQRLCIFLIQPPVPLYVLVSRVAAVHRRQQRHLQRRGAQHLRAVLRAAVVLLIVAAAAAVGLGRWEEPRGQAHGLRGLDHRNQLAGGRHVHALFSGWRCREGQGDGSGWGAGRRAKQVHASMHRAHVHSSTPPHHSPAP